MLGRIIFRIEDPNESIVASQMYLFWIGRICAGLLDGGCFVDEVRLLSHADVDYWEVYDFHLLVFLFLGLVLVFLGAG